MCQEPVILLKTDFRTSILEPGLVCLLQGMQTKMKFTILKALLLPIALLALGSINHASAATCNSSYTMAAVTTPGFSCTFNFLTFSNFNYLPSVSLMSGCGGVGEPACPPKRRFPIRR